MLDILMIQQIRSKSMAIIYRQLLLLAVIFDHLQPYKKGPVEVRTVDPSGAMWHVVALLTAYLFPFSAFLVCS